MRVILFTLFTLILSNAGAQESAAETEQKCSDASQMAEVIMRQRLAGLPMRELMSFTASADISPEVRRLAQLMIEDAYGQPKWQTDERVTEAISEFGNKYYLICIQNSG